MFVRRNALFILLSTVWCATVCPAGEELKTVRITRDAVCPGTIGPFQYGQFIEHLCDLVPAMWAEKLYDGSFEGLRPYDFEYVKATDFKEKPWYPSGAVNRAAYTLDNSTKVSGDVSQQIEVKDGTPCTMGISQDGLAVDAADPCTFSCYLKQQGVSGAVTVTVQDESHWLATCQFRPGQDWRRFHAVLKFAAQFVQRYAFPIVSRPGHAVDR